MAFQLSAGVNFSEIDLTTVVPAVATSDAAIAGVFRWGPVGERILIDSETLLAKRFGKPTSYNAETYYSAANFLSYSNRLWVSRAGPSNTYNSVANSGVVNSISQQLVLNQNDYTIKDGTFDTDVQYIAKYPGDIGNSLRISVCDNSNSFSSNVTSPNTVTFTIGYSNSTVVCANATAANTLAASLAVGDLIIAGNSSIGKQYLKIANVSTITANVSIIFEDPYRLRENYSSNTIQRFWEFSNVVETAPGQSDYVANFGNTSAQDELHVVVVDDGGGFTGTPGTILEVFKGVSRATDAKNNDGSGNYYKDVINQNSAYVWWANDRGNASSNTSANVATATTTAPLNLTFSLGADGSDEANTSSYSSITAAYDLFASPEDIDISLIIQGRPLGGSTSIKGVTVENFQLANYIIDNICEIRRDCVALISPEKDMTINSFGTEATNLVAWRGALHSTSYAVLDSGYKYQYDKYNDVYRWIPLNGDIAGLCARTDQTNDAWWSPAGFNRGQIKNLVKLAWNPRKAERDVLYSNGVNPIVTFPGQGTILYGDKTLQAKPSAFDRINVRRLFIVLEKAISISAKYSLFEFNDAFTRSQFKNLVTPYLRTIKGRRGITDFLVVCDDTNNTAQIIDTNQFVGDIYIKPARSINFIQLNFVAVGTGVQFSEVVGRF
ncbi:tail sheath protein [uncultured Caudovirales phage]|uniref:Tail sheath protein n=1 Tax=uncultured Caudovirales phage TaxID=2100421 RepID=A0A6J5P5Q5_9CAUD|nr:tail sheath protein [uncultured Caudovirales phage]